MAAVRRPDPPVTVAFAAPPATVQAPPTSAVPQPPVTSRPKASAARAVDTGGVAGSVTVTCLVTVPVAPAESVTVSFTE